MLPSAFAARVLASSPSSLMFEALPFPLQAAAAPSLLEGIWNFIVKVLVKSEEQHGPSALPISFREEKAEAKCRGGAETRWYERLHARWVAAVACVLIVL